MPKYEYRDLIEMGEVDVVQWFINLRYEAAEVDFDEAAFNFANAYFEWEVE